jgi:acyl-coenzyme A synthetase/AMP-(fatty) acid ligase
VPADGAGATADELIEHVAAELTPHKRPREVRFTDLLPRNALGKVQKQRLKES